MERTPECGQRPTVRRRVWPGPLLAACLAWSLPGHAVILMCTTAPLPFESTLQGYEDCMTLDSLQFGVGRSIGLFSGSGRESSNPAFSELLISTTLQTGLTDLYLGTAAAMDLGTVTLDILEVTCAGSSTLPILQIKLADTLLSQYVESSGGERPSEALSLNFTSICVRQNRCDNNTVVAGEFKGWNLQTNEVSSCSF